MKRAKRNIGEDYSDTWTERTNMDYFIEKSRKKILLSKKGRKKNNE